MGSAYKDEKTRQVVAVYVNMSAEPRVVQLEVGLGRRNWRLKSTVPHVTSESDGDDLKAYPAVPPGGPVAIPARSVVTVMAQYS
jgi:hypothetical protein